MSANTLNRVGVIGDVHGEDEALACALDCFEQVGVDAVMCVGDIADGYGDVDRCCVLLRNAGAMTVTGNHDRWLLSGEHRSLPMSTTELSEDSRLWLADLPATIRFETPRGGAMLCHGIGDDDMAVLRSDTTGYALQSVGPLRELMLDGSLQYVLGGHTHEAMVRRFAGLTVVNAGTLHREYHVGICIVDFATEQIERFDIRDGQVAFANSEALPPPAPLS